MAFANVVSNTNSMLIVDYDRSPFLLGYNRYIRGNYTNDDYETVELPRGLVMSRIASTGKVVPIDPAANDGSQFPLGVLQRPMTVEPGDTVSLPLVVAGQLALESIFLPVGVTLETIISSRRLRDRIASDTLGLEFIAGTELSAHDNH